MTNGNIKHDDIEHKDEPQKKSFMQKGLDFWFFDEKNLKLFRFGLWLVTILVWIVFPIFVIAPMFTRAVQTKSLGLYLLAVIITYGFMGAVRGLNMLFKITSVFNKKNA